MIEKSGINKSLDDFIKFYDLHTKTTSKKSL